MLALYLSKHEFAQNQETLISGGVDIVNAFGLIWF